MSLRVRRGSDANRRLSMIFMIAIAAVTVVLIAVAVFFQLSGNSQGGGDSSSGSGSIYDEDAERICQAVEQKLDRGIEVNLVNGGQPVYYFLISIE